MLYKPRALTTHQDAAKLLQEYIGEPDREMLVGIYLNIKCEPTHIHTISVGNLESSIVHPREVYKVALFSNAAALILGHNHPSGDPTPSKADIEINRRLMQAGQILGVELLDHIILGRNGTYVSLDERGEM